MISQVTNSYGAATTSSLKGDIIYFPHDGPKEAAETLEQRVAWLRGSDFRVVLVGPEGDRDKLSRWLLGRSILNARPHTCYNHLAVRAAIDRAMQNPSVAPAPDFNLLAEALSGLSESLAKNARVISTPVANAVETIRQVESDDVASVRDSASAEAFSCVGLLPSGHTTMEDATRAELRAVKQVLNAGDGSGADARASDAGAEDEQDARAEAAAEQGSDDEQHVREEPRPVPRGSEPLGDFEQNGLNLMRLFADVCPLRR